VNVRVKICGITNVEDALLAAEAGADALGFMFCESSPRYLSPAEASAIIRQLPPFLFRVGVFVNATEDVIRRTVAECGLDRVQLHGDETPDFCRQLPVPVIKALRVKDADSLRALSGYDVIACLLDSFVPGVPGGTGAAFNWELALQAKASGQRIILAGGLTPDNIVQAVRKVQPYGVDVSSGVESSPGKKDPAKVRMFIASAKGA